MISPRHGRRSARRPPRGPCAPLRAARARGGPGAAAGKWGKSWEKRWEGHGLNMGITDEF